MKNFCIIFAIASGIFLSGCRTSTCPETPKAVQIDISSLLNARVVFTEQAGQLQPVDHSLDRGNTSVLITESAAKLAQSGKLNPLPDSGFFAADTNHPDVQLAYGIVAGGAQVHRSPARAETYSFAVPKKRYTQMQLFFISANGPTPLSVKLKYADGSSELRTTVVPDFYWLLKPADTNWFVLANDFGKVNQQGKMTESVHHFIHGFNLNPDPAQKLRAIEVTKLDSKSVLNLFGVTGKLAD